MKREADLETINIRVVAQDGAQVHFKVKTTTQLSKVFDSYCQRQGITRNTVRFVFDGDRLFDTYMPKDIGLEDGDEIDVLVDQTGC